MFKCKLKIEGRYKKLSLENGLSIEELGEVLSKLAKCLKTSGFKFTLTGVDNTSYSPVIETDDRRGVDKFNEVHNDILTESFEDLSIEVKEYAISLNKILFVNGIYLVATNDKDNTEITVSSIPISHKRTFISITSITGQIVDIIGHNEDKPYVTLATPELKIYRVFISKEQEKKLGHFYKEGNIRLRVSIKIDAWANDIVSAKLIDYEIPERKSFLDSINATKSEFGDIFPHIKDSAKALRELRNEYPSYE